MVDHQVGQAVQVDQVGRHVHQALEVVGVDPLQASEVVREDHLLLQEVVEVEAGLHVMAPHQEEVEVVHLETPVW